MLISGADASLVQTFAQLKDMHRHAVPLLLHQLLTLLVPHVFDILGFEHKVLGLKHTHRHAVPLLLLQLLALLLLLVRGPHVADAGRLDEVGQHKRGLLDAALALCSDDSSNTSGFKGMRY